GCDRAAHRGAVRDLRHAHLEATAPPGSTPRRGGPLMSRYRYDIDGIVHVHSSVRLPELKFFSTKEEHRPDLVVRVGTVGIKPRFNVTIKNGGTTLRYEEHLGWLSANFSVHMGDPVVVTVNPILAISPHVVYTNI